MPSASTLSIGLLFSTRLNPSGFAVALFAPDYAVDAQGRVLQLAEGDWAGLKTLTRQATADDLPKPFQWRIKHDKSDYPIHTLRVSYGEGDVRDVQVYGFSNETKELEEPVEGLTQLPDAIQEAIAVLDEGRTTEGPGEGDDELVKLVSEILDSA